MTLRQKCWFMDWVWKPALHIFSLFCKIGHHQHLHVSLCRHLVMWLQSRWKHFLCRDWWSRKCHQHLTLLWFVPEIIHSEIHRWGNGIIPLSGHIRTQSAALEVSKKKLNYFISKDVFTLLLQHSDRVGLVCNSVQGFIQRQIQRHYDANFIISSSHEDSNYTLT